MESRDKLTLLHGLFDPFEDDGGISWLFICNKKKSIKEKKSTEIDPYEPKFYTG